MRKVGSLNQHEFVVAMLLVLVKLLDMLHACVCVPKIIMIRALSLRLKACRGCHMTKTRGKRKGERVGAITDEEAERLLLSWRKYLRGDPAALSPIGGIGNKAAAMRTYSSFVAPGTLWHAGLDPLRGPVTLK